MTPEPFQHIIPMDIVNSLLICVSVWVLFGKLYRPPTQTRRIALAASAVLWQILWNLFMQSTIPWLVEGICILGLLVFALLSGNFRMSVFSAVFLLCIIDSTETIYQSFISYFNHRAVSLFEPSYAVRIFFIYAVGLVWTLNYYRRMRNLRDNLPLRYYLVTVFLSVGTVAFLWGAFFNFNTLLETVGGTVYLFTGIVGLFLLALNLLIFFLYTGFLTAYQARIFAEQVSNVPPVWTKTAGLSVDFIAKFGITEREGEIVNSLLNGKSDKDIASALNIAVSTAQTHLKNIYRKTGVSGRFALQALLRS